ncbi:serine hydrolase domain-containing protein [Lentzea flaviverrucosa]|uniref:D-alanyl-D-alanine carboxypeptidase n=1 Tax=Lentzea flaviverrucosa TaxID=200379 RepID=A0A1H9RXX6_9PSEU|nr:serine hydrolase domain-containing protein [Lentzea flaviverrucosa]RDI33198.1 D-alanyl-D-alanine carboxypeptidase [Lentzea flaviverrucosa]SER77652.1 D-alanyl-D-alanine carboxypeptidase [Lentzea flaviverrucosa]
MGTRLLATLAAFSLLFTGTAVADNDARVDRRIVQEGLDELAATGTAQGTQLRVTDGRNRFTARSGTAEMNNPRPVPLNGRFRAGSITKSFTSAVTLQLAGEGRISLDAPVDRYLPGLIDQRITVRQLLQMTGGLFNYTNELPFDPQGFEAIRFKRWQPEELVAIATSKPLNFEPGTRWEYNNTNYVILGMLIEKVTGRKYEQVVAQRVLKPLHLDETTFPGNDPEIRGPHAHSYGIVNGQPVDTTRWNPSVFWAVGDVITTTRDLDTFYTALLTGKLLEPAQRAELTKTTAVSTDYGLGVFVEKAPCGTTIIGHPGGVPGFASYAYSTPDLKRRAEFSISTGVGTGDPNPAFAKLINEIFC